ncbi:uncharacterized protein Z518_09899 [Rhinocladiella mackenziei CBS 650.93]|uniref:Uncharacterized protein n=1 Tax=Rhinocladiella mackenziei CBS 650.93 TaxID=1442369 RepID=A0A0D2I4V1_9EURO|nr:uncharacterized protein Z518_09899 [Rhinocladiella mackenziei CBS 650.93]KIX00834.1 hypothetical protein Z518_09899 [Rhinocladiella mackenziei CBS 650.93]
MGTQKPRKGKRPRRESSDELCIEEMSPDDMGYDGDVEVLRPDQYEDAESDFEDDKALGRLWPDTDDELAGRLRRLSCDPQIIPLAHRDDSDRGRKRRSREMDDEDLSPLTRSPEIEVSELVDGPTDQPAPKRRKHKSSKQSMAPRVIKKQALEAWSDSSDKTDDREATIEASDSETPDARSTPAPGDGELDVMDIG